jgi:hypothetical protein
LASIAARHHMVDGTLELDSQSSGHPRSTTPTLRRVKKKPKTKFDPILLSVPGATAGDPRRPDVPNLTWRFESLIREARGRRRLNLLERQLAEASDAEKAFN